TLRIAVGLTFQLGGNLGEGLSLLWTVIGAAWRCRAAFLAKRGSEEQVTAARQLRQSAGATYDRALRARLKALDIERAVFQGGALRDVFTRPRLKDTPAPAFIPAARRLSAYHGAGIDLRFTRTNLRSGRLEYSAFFTPGRALFNRGDDGNFKLKEQGDLRVFGDPRVVDAAIASGAFPFAFPPRRFEELYPAPEPGEAAAYQELLADFVNYLARRDAGGVGDLVAPPACRWTEHDDATGEARTYQAALTEADWRQIASVFPRPGDLYVDGGAIDNTPLASAISATRDAGAGELQAIVVMLDPAPEYRAIARSEMESLTPLGIGLRALQLQANARLERDAEHAEALTRRWANLMQAASEAGARDAVEGGAGQSGLMPVSVVRIWPGPPPERPLPPLLAFDERLGYNREDSRAALTQGCAAMLWALWEQAEKIEAGDAVRRRVESFVQPDSVSGARSPQTWHCANRDCRYYQEQNPALRCRRAE
ncbi:MAG: hypothetical protein HY023_09830, partial [Chloroflexi bacterium]|nr:hypothetical protein [Chloroflexota bacterium]